MDSDHDSEDDSKPPKPGYERIYASCCLYYDRPIQSKPSNSETIPITPTQNVCVSDPIK